MHRHLETSPQSPEYVSFTLLSPHFKMQIFESNKSFIKTDVVLPNLHDSCVYSETTIQRTQVGGVEMQRSFHSSSRCLVREKSYATDE